jgi:hypothetical protein
MSAEIFSDDVEKNLSLHLQMIANALQESALGFQERRMILDELEDHIRTALAETYGPAATPEQLALIIAKMDPPEAYREMADTSPRISNSQQGKTSPHAIASLICLCASPFLLGIPLIPTIICGHIARAQIKKNAGMKGLGIAIAGLCLGYIGLGLLCYFFIVYFLTKGHEVPL